MESFLCAQGSVVAARTQQQRQRSLVRRCLVVLEAHRVSYEEPGWEQDCEREVSHRHRGLEPKHEPGGQRS